MKKIFLCLLILILISGCSQNDKDDAENQIRTNTNKQTNSTNNYLELENEATSMPPTILPTITPEAIKNVDIEDNEVLDNLNGLCSTPRFFNTNGQERGLNFLIDKMTTYGYDTKIQEFSVYSKNISDVLSATSKWQYFDKYTGDKNSLGKEKNIIATTGNPDKKKTLYITAHYDTTSDTNGIRDNGSGVVVVMEIARQLKDTNLPINVEFVFFGGEETGLQGSAYFVSHLTNEEKDNALGCINIDVVGQKGNNETVLKTFFGQMNVLSLLMDEYHNFPHQKSEASDHTSFAMGEIPAIYFADETVITKDSSNNPSDELDLKRLKELIIIICNFILNFNLDDYNNLLESSYIKEYTNLPDTEEILGYSLVQVNKLLRENGAGSDIQYILKNDKGNQVKITEKDIRFLGENLKEELHSYNSYNEHVKYKILQKNDKIVINYKDDWLVFYYHILEGNISEDNALNLLNSQGKFTKDGNLEWELEEQSTN